MVNLVVFLCVFLSAFLLVFFLINLKEVSKTRKKNKPSSSPTQSGESFSLIPSPAAVSPRPFLSPADFTLMEQVKKAHEGPAIDKMLDSIFQDEVNLSAEDLYSTPAHPEPCQGREGNYFFPLHSTLFTFRSAPLEYLGVGTRPGISADFQSLVADVLKH